ncbi:hypothetical protein ABTZ03_31525 [Kitasatospora sp. NPDC096077]
MGRTIKSTTKNKVDKKATSAQNKQDAEKRALVEKFKDKTGDGGEKP